MNVDALYVIQRSDVAHIVAHRARFEGLRLIFTDPGTLDEAVQAGLNNFEFRRLDVGPDLQAQAATEALARATLVDQQLTLQREAVFGHGLFAGWDVGLFFLSLMRTAVSARLAAHCQRSFKEARIGLLRPSNVQQFYFDSFITAELFVQQDPGRWQVVDGYDNARQHQPQLLDRVFDCEALAQAMAARPVSAITHVPTCFYDRAWLADEIGRVHRHSVDLPSPLWDVPVRREQVLWRARPAVPDPQARAYRERARSVLQDLLGPLLPGRAAREQQVEFWACRCEWQATNYLGLQQALAGHRPQFVVSDQDTGSNGPLFSIANALGAELLVVPHSSHPTMVLPHARRVTAVQRAGFSTGTRTVNGQSVPVRSVRWGAQAQRRERTSVRTVCLLLNSLQTEGLSYVDLLGLTAFYKPLAAWCDAHDVELVVRLKPSAPAISVVAGALGVAAPRLYAQLTQPLDDLAARTDLCLAWGEPTTGMVGFMDSGALTLNVCDQRWPQDYLVCPPFVRDGIVASLSPAEAWPIVQRLCTDPTLFDNERRAQSAACDALSAVAHDTLFPTPAPGAR